METHRRKSPFKRTSATTTTTTTIPPPSPPPPAPPLPPVEGSLMLKPASLFIKFIAFQADIISNCLLFLSSSFLNFLSLNSKNSLHRAADGTRDTTEEAASVATHVHPHFAGGGGRSLLQRLGLGLLGAAYVCIVLLIVMIFAIIMGVGLVRWWVEGPVVVKEPLHFDYTDPHPNALFSLGDAMHGNRKRAIPSGHTFHVSVVLVMPESYYNQRIGVFQLIAEVISTTGEIKAKSSQPCMLHYRSIPVRLMRTFVYGIPLVLDYLTETQRIKVGLLKHREGKPQTEAIRVTIIPRAGTISPPELYTAEIILNSRLPWRKELIYNWKLTSYVWATLSVYIMLMMLLVCCFRPSFPKLMPTGVNRQSQGEYPGEVYYVPQPQPQPQPQTQGEGDGETSDTTRTWQRSRRRRQLFPERVRVALPEPAGSSALGATVISADTSEVIDDSGGFTDAESVCLGG